MKKHFARLFAYLVIIALVLQTTPIQALPITEASEAIPQSSSPRQDLTAWQLEPKLPDEALSPGEDLRTPAEERELIPPTAAEFVQPAKPESSFDCTPVSDIPPDECDALVDLYYSTNGTGWAIRTHWLEETPAANWYGVTVSGGHVTELNLSSNLLSGSLPYWLRDLTDLEYLYLQNNQIGGTIPDLSSFYELRVLNLSNNLLTGSISADLGGLYILNTLNLGSNLLTGSIPAELGDLSFLYYLNLGSNQLSGSLPAELGNMTSLDYLNLGSNQLTGSIPAELGNMTYLDYLNLGSNPLIGMIPLNFSNLEYLSSFYFNGTSLCEPTSSAFILWKENVSTWIGTGVNCGAFCQTVTDVPYHECDILKRFYESTNGDEWNRKDNWLITTTVGNWHGIVQSGGHVIKIDVSSNLLNGSILPELANLGSLQQLNLHSNQLVGSIPTELGKLGSLKDLNLFENKLSGSIPDVLGNLGSLEYLFLYKNQLSGSIPSTLGSLGSLRELKLSSNQLSGSIPSTLGSLGNLRQLSLDRNNLTGSIPSQLGSLTNLYFLNLSQNKLSGDVPATFANLVNLCTRDIKVYPCWGVYESDLGYNHLNVPAPEPPASFLAIKDPDWYLTQAVEKVIDGAIGGMFFSNDGTVKLEVPAGAVSGNITFLLEPRPSPSQSTGMRWFAGNSFNLTAWDSLGPVTVFSTPITLTITYDDGDLGNTPEESLGLYYWDASTSAWLDVITTCPGGAYTRNLAENWLSVPVCHLSEFALLRGNVYTIFMPLLVR